MVLMNCGRASSFCRSRSAPRASAMTGRPDVPKALRIAVVGDVHEDWDPVKDHMALRVLKPDLVLFTGDFGEENVELVKSISDLNFPKSVILGNHDCWWTAGPYKRIFSWQARQKKYRADPCQDPDNVTAQLLALGQEHVGYSRLDYPQYQLSVVGGRPFSSGGANFNPADLLGQRYGIRNMVESEIRITEMALGAPVDHSLIFLAHNGPLGLGPNRYDICGKDWVRKAGDHGDRDLAAAIATVQATGRRKIPLVVFGHMHKKLQVVGERTMVVAGANGTVYLNGAVVPRSRRMLVTDPNSTEPVPPPETCAECEGNLIEVSDRQFTVVDFQKGELKRIAEVWIREGNPLWVVEETQIYTSATTSTT